MAHINLHIAVRLEFLFCPVFNMNSSMLYKLKKSAAESQTPFTATLNLRKFVDKKSMKSVMFKAWYLNHIVIYHAVKNNNENKKRR